MSPPAVLVSVMVAFVCLLQTLSPRQRAALVLLDQYGYASEEAARIMGSVRRPSAHWQRRYRLMRGILEAFRDARNPFSILTKGTLVLRDIDLLQQAAAVAPVSAAFSIGTVDEDAWRRSEPGTPHPKARIEAVRTLNAAGIPTGVLMAPILPGIKRYRPSAR